MTKITEENMDLWTLSLGIITLIIICCIIGFFGYFIWGPSLCQDWKKGMSAAEKIQTAVIFTNNLNSPRFKFEKPDGSISYDLLKQVKYEDPLQIIQDNPTCCKLYADDEALHTDKPNEKTNPYEEGVVVLEYAGKYQDLKGQIHSGTISMHASFNTCR